MAKVDNWAGLMGGRNAAFYDLEMAIKAKDAYKAKLREWEERRTLIKKRELILELPSAEGSPASPGGEPRSNAEEPEKECPKSPGMSPSDPTLEGPSEEDEATKGFSSESEDDASDWPEYASDADEVEIAGEKEAPDVEYAGEMGPPPEEESEVDEEAEAAEEAQIETAVPYWTAREKVSYWEREQLNLMSDAKVALPRADFWRENSAFEVLRVERAKRMRRPSTRANLQSLN